MGWAFGAMLETPNAEPVHGEGNFTAPESVSAAALIFNFRCAGVMGLFLLVEQ